MVIFMRIKELKIENLELKIENIKLKMEINRWEGSQDFMRMYPASDVEYIEEELALEMLKLENELNKLYVELNKLKEE